MKKVIAMVLALTTMLSMTAFAANFETNYAEGAALPTGTTVTGTADSIAVSTTAVDDAYYGILLIEGSTLPTEDDYIYYIDQKTADGTSVSFDVLPLMTNVAANDTLTLYISSNSGADLIAIPMTYAEEVVEEPTVYTVGDVDGDGEITIGDVTTEIDFVLKKVTRFKDAEQNIIPMLVGDTDADTTITIGDVTTSIDKVLKKIENFSTPTYSLPYGTTADSTYPAN